MNPKVGIFWFDLMKKELFCIHKENPDNSEMGTCATLHKETWDDRADNPNLIPRGRVWHRNGNTFFITAGQWINENPCILELVKAEFELPDDVEIVLDEHWDVKEEITAITEEAYPPETCTPSEQYCNWRNLCGKYRFSLVDFGKVRQLDGVFYRLIGFNPVKPKNCIRLKRMRDGVMCVCDRDTANKIFN